MIYGILDFVLFWLLPLAFTCAESPMVARFLLIFLRFLDVVCFRLLVRYHRVFLNICWIREIISASSSMVSQTKVHGNVYKCSPLLQNPRWYLTRKPKASKITLTQKNKIPSISTRLTPQSSWNFGGGRTRYHRGLRCANPNPRWYIEGRRHGRSPLDPLLTWSTSIFSLW